MRERFEYLVTNIESPTTTDGIQETMDMAGDQRWELVAVVPIVSEGCTKRTQHYFKRELV